MAELVDAPGSGPGGGNTVEVRVLFSAPAWILAVASLRKLAISSRFSEGMPEHDGLFAIRSGGNDIDRHGAGFFYSL